MAKAAKSRRINRGPSKAVQAARERRLAKASDKNARLTLNLDNLDKIKLPMKTRIGAATEYLRNEVVKNISIPVTRESRSRKASGWRIYNVVTRRSDPGEYPRADTTQLMKTILHGVQETEPGVYEGYVGTPLHYGLILETDPWLDRPFLTRTFYEEIDVIRRILSGPLK